MLQIRLLGPLEIERDSRPVEIGGQKVCVVPSLDLVVALDVLI